ncbi:MAG: molybdenum cofactor biosynthesis protein MoaE [Gemmatimonadetes bacterium]|uniref:Molybdopterin synthase catalytic subunit n=1 Tax=Candidatus Kutchimonas denitrificans TaxID=3056748 RepID=A0AAE4Z9V8_9BACT|nr:molybdenum cofactor biosynthesis protein MoaE [Gemmatimonadota bacterium]NIR75202.1 molybdenum cofactor biosynthesis protein MoaE [Candidatus Kutchimonas denitrificans]NIS00140.1 molybdenum cofactor biosynthesis protein MoaE [Gemmatimonadota bacterium]NIT65732.1 molybdenum cofactor biosynthesis protein MoaE [Gemmatimonadota bacterium]NIU53010.1 molybdenum cofactor biosynthesis protein MoaE [Gemmatimonadota bacterium]
MYCAIITEPIDASELASRVRTDADGAVITFTGVVRNHHEGRPVEALRYETYREMAEGKLRRICEEAAARFEVGDIAVVHRVGQLAIGDIAVAIAVAAPHRDAAYRASREIIERIKREVPIWKRERYADGGEDWQEGTPVDLRSG